MHAHLSRICISRKQIENGLFPFPGPHAGELFHLMGKCHFCLFCFLFCGDKTFFLPRCQPGGAQTSSAMQWAPNNGKLSFKPDGNTELGGHSASQLFLPSSLFLLQSRVLFILFNLFIVQKLGQNWQKWIANTLSTRNFGPKKSVFHEIRIFWGILSHFCVFFWNLV